MRIYIIILIMILLTACAPSAQVIQTAIAQTQSVWTPTPAATATPKTLATILKAYGFSEHTELETTCNCTIYKSALSTKGMTTIQIANDGSMVIVPPGQLNVLLPMLEEIYGKDLAGWISDEAGKYNKNSLHLEHESGFAGGHAIEIDFVSVQGPDIQLIQIK